MKKKKLIFIELNEINFDIVKLYIDKGLILPNFKKILSMKSIITRAENNYEEIEPWIQWHSVHTGLEFSEHRIFRLGDGVNCKKKGIHRKLEEIGFTVGAISPMNLKNDLLSAKFFIPDPWTKTKSDSTWWSKQITEILQQTVNDNASSKITFKSGIVLILALIKFAHMKNYFKYLTLAINSFLGNSWAKALFLDLFISDLYLELLKKNKPNYSSIFLNAGAHIQHHYYYNSTVINKQKNPSWYINNNIDPFCEMLKVYDLILGNLLRLNLPIIIATGMSQVVNDKKEFYYRLKNHKRFLDILKIKYLNIATRMSRDFEIYFDNKDLRDKAFEILKELKVSKNNINFFEIIEKRENNLFLTLTYPYEITDDLRIIYNDINIKLKDHTIFVAIKNGKHQSKGFAFFSDEIKKHIPTDNSHVKNLHGSVINYFH